MDNIRKLSLLLVDQQGSRLRGASVEDLPGPVDNDHQVLSGSPQKVPEIVTVHHQKVQSRKAAAAKQLGRLIVQDNPEAVIDHVQSRGYGDPQGGGVLRII